MVQYALAFCQITIGLVFAWSVTGKIQNIPSFIQTISRFRILPEVLHYPVAFMFLIGELAVVGAMTLGGKLLFWGFLLAGLLLILFSVALISVLIRKIQSTCNCFGTSEKIISVHDIWRNILLIGFALLGWMADIVANTTTIRLDLFEIGLIGCAAAMVLIILTQLGEIVRFLVGQS